MEDWIEQNNRYLGASLEWLRARLRCFAAAEPAPAPSTSSAARPPSAEPREPGLFGRLRHREATVNSLPMLKAARSASADDLARDAAARRAAATSSTEPPALHILAERLGLSDFERDTLLLCAAAELDPTLGSLLAQIPINQGRSYPTFGLALAVFEDAAWDVLSPHRPLRRMRLVEINQPGATPLTASPLRADERVVGFLKGLNVLDDRLGSVVEYVGSGATLAASQQHVVDDILLRLRSGSPDAPIPVVQLVGSDPESRLAFARQACAVLQRDLYLLSADAVPSQPVELESLARLWNRESLLTPVALFVETESAEHTDALAGIQRLVSGNLGLVFVGTREAPLRLSGPSFSLNVARPNASEQTDAWQRAIGESSSSTDARPIAGVLAGQFNLGLEEIRRAHATASVATAEEGLEHRLWEACRDLTRTRLDGLAERLVPKSTWDDLVLPDEQTSLLHQVAGQVRERQRVYHEWGFAETMNRGFGISALFAGESGTGKTMAAEVLANDLSLDLYRIDLSAVVSKYIGETEKNLARLFDAAERGGSILFFDEADALFGKRSEVKDSHDRYANIEINYLLQRMEGFGGLAILATNMKTALDPAFMRRLRFVVNLPFPGLAERRRIWERALPPKTPVRGLDFERLARLNVSGGNIHSIALNAAFAAARADGEVSMSILLAAARDELRKLERPFSESEFRALEAAAVKP